MTNTHENTFTDPLVYRNANITSFPLLADRLTRNSVNRITAILNLFTSFYLKRKDKSCSINDDLKKNISKTKLNYCTFLHFLPIIRKNKNNFTIIQLNVNMKIVFLVKLCYIPIYSISKMKLLLYTSSFQI